ncbi:hypothetical protein LFT45_04315 [Arthrobacter sp. FW305-BF8]|uniref:hypothetical protein n=1 Tax=Arthrobacter sp. FW305-BF8 TaxID=2879617 RepID=UPI001F22594A|nr:hypothetical protein [Arthrobacter sp. FW305-BF8]UKA55166.1 hypothetical protein LFT45_04315 [Arthrobacter sp. FW305-BF8]
MDANPVLKPKLATPALIVVSVVMMVCAISLLASVAATWPSQWLSVMAALAFLLATTTVGAIWLSRVRRLRTWTAVAREQWKNFDEAKRVHGTTAEVTILSVDALEPTGSWITIRWNRFDHVQSAWLEALHEPIWPGSVLLISPDPAQVRPGAPWPTTYYLPASDCLAWAPAAVSKPSTPHLLWY